MVRIARSAGRRKGVWLVLVILSTLFGPVITRQLLPPEPRQFERVALSDLSYAEISFRNERQGLDLGGMLFRPPGDGPFPAAVIIHGSGTSNRQNGWYLTLTRHLQDNGIVVLLPDKRGSEKSEGDWRTSSFEDLATDTLAAVEFVRSQPDVDASRAGVIGMSQGGWIAPIVASQTGNLAFLVSMVGAVVTPGEQLLYEENYNIREVGFLPGISNLLAYVGYANVRYRAQPELYDLIVDYDPLPYWNKISVPSLALFGADDTNVPSAESEKRLRSLDNPYIQLRVYPDSGHALESPESQGSSIIRTDALEAISGFVKDTTVRVTPRPIE